MCDPRVQVLAKLASSDEEGALLLALEKLLSPEIVYLCSSLLPRETSAPFKTAIATSSPELVAAALDGHVRIDHRALFSIDDTEVANVVLAYDDKWDNQFQATTCTLANVGLLNCHLIKALREKQIMGPWHTIIYTDGWKGETSELAFLQGVGSASPETMKRIVRNLRDVNHFDCLAYSPMLLAYERQDYNTVALLLARGGDTSKLPIEVKQCPICLVNNQVITLPCLHYLCLNCLVDGCKICKF